MTPEQLEKAKQIMPLIEATREAIAELDEWMQSSKQSCGGERYKSDKNFNLHVAEHRDCSGRRLNLSRYFGNTRLLEVIYDELVKQLAEFERDFSEL